MVDTGAQKRSARTLRRDEGAIAMRNLALGLIAAIALASAPQTAQAGVGSYVLRSGVKLTHGVADVLYSPVELVISPVTHIVDYDRHNRIGLYGVGPGMFVGMVKAESRFIRGFADAFTFFLPSERHSRWDWEWSFAGWQVPLSEPQMMEDAR
jgi:hypothetical protein